MCTAPSGICLTDVIYHKHSFEHASMNIYPEINTLRCQKNCFRLYPSIRTSQLMKKTGCICNDKYKLCEKSIASSIRGFKCVFICKINLAILQGEIAVGADVMWQVEGPDDPTAECLTQPGKTSAGESSGNFGGHHCQIFSSGGSDSAPPCMSTSAGILQTGVFTGSREGGVLQTVVTLNACHELKPFRWKWAAWSFQVAGVSQQSQDRRLLENWTITVAPTGCRTSLSGVIKVWWTSHGLLWFSVTWQKQQQIKKDIFLVSSLFSN